MQQEKTRTRLLMLACIACGSLAAGLYWRNGHPARKTGINEEQARQRGFASSEEYARSDAASRRLLSHFHGKGELDEGDFSYVRSTLRNGPWSAQVPLIHNLGNVSPRQHGKVLDILGLEPIPKNLRTAWTYALTDWIRNQHNPGASANLLASKNPDIVDIARGIESEKP
jgi:hypothetical protein